MLPIVAEMDYLTQRLTERCDNTAAPAVMPETTKGKEVENASTQTFVGGSSIAVQTDVSGIVSSNPRTLQRGQSSSSQGKAQPLQQPTPHSESAPIGVHKFIRERLARLQQPLPRSIIVQEKGIAQKIRTALPIPARVMDENIRGDLPPWDKVT